MLTLRYMPNTSSVLHLHPTLFVQSLCSPFLIPRILYSLVYYRHVTGIGNESRARIRAAEEVGTDVTVM